MSNIDIGDLNLSDLDFSDFDFTDTNTDMDDYNEYLNTQGTSFPSFATLAYYQALSRDEMQYGAEAEYRQQFYNFINQLSNQIYNAIANGQSTISRGDKYQPYPDDPTLAASVDGFFNAIFGSDGEADVYEVVNSDLYSEAVSEYNSAPYYFDFAAGWSTLDSPSALVESAETANQERLDDIAAQEEADRIAEEEAERQRQEEEAAARQAALDNADSIFRTAGYNPTATEVATFADNPDGIADYIDPRQVTTEEARQLLNDAGIPDSVLDGEFAERWATVIDAATGQGDENFQSTVNTNLGDYADKRIVTEAEARGYFEDLGYEPSPEEIADFVGVIDDPMRTDNYDTRNNVGDYVDPRQITEAEARGYFEDLGYDPSPEEIQDFIGQGDADFESTRSGELGTYVDEHQVTRAELEQIAAEQGYELDPDDDYGQYIRQGADIDQADIKATAERDFDEGATSVEEVQEIYRRRAGVDISNAEAQALLDLAILEGDGSPNLSEEGFGGWATENIEIDLRQHLENLGNGVLNILFGSTDVEEILQQQMETLLPPSPSEENYEEKYNEWLKRQSGSIISINNSPATSGTWAGVRFPVPIPVSGPEVIIPIFDVNGVYQGPSSVGELLIGENGVITQVKEGIETQIGEIKETGIEIFGEDGQGGVLGQVIDLGQATIDTVTGQATYTPEDPGIIFNEETGEVYETGAETGMPVAEDPDRDRDSYPNEEDAFPDDPNEWLDTDEDGVGDNADVFPEDPNETVDTDADGVGDNADVFPEDASETLDTDGDGVGDNADVFDEDPTEWADTDEDGVGNNADAFPEDASETLDTDGDGVGDNSDLFPEDASETADADGDGVGDNSDLFPEDPNETLDTDGDGVGDNSDLFPEDASESVDTDGDGVGDNSDLFPEDATETADTDGDGVGDSSDAFPEDANESVDTDGDGVGDNTDAFPENADETLDTDADGVGDNQDAFPEDANESIDTDGDGVGDNTDAFPDDNTENVDTDGDGVGDNQDAFPEDGSESLDSDKDGVGDNADAFPTDPGETIDTDGDGVGDNTDEYPEDDRVTGLEDFATQQDVQDAKDDILSVLNDPEDGLRAELTALGLSQDEIRNLIGDPAVADDPTTEEDESRPATGLYELIEAADNTDDIAAISTQITNLVGTPEYAEDGTTIIGGTGLYGLYDETKDIKDILGEAEYDDEGNLIGGTGLYGDLYSQQQAIANLNDLSEEQVRDIVDDVLTQAGLTDLNDLSKDQVKDIVGEVLSEYGFENLSEEDVERIIGQPSSEEGPASGVYELLENLNDLSEDDVTRIVGDIVGTPATEDDPTTPDIDESQDATGLFEFVGEPAYDEDGNLTEDSTGLYLEFYNAGLSDTEIKELIGTPDNPETDENEASGLYLAYQQGTESTQNYIDDVVNPQLVSISDRLGTPAVEDDPTTEEDESEDATGLYLAVEEGDQAVIDYIGAPEIDPETGEIVGGTGLYADLYALGLDTDRIIELIGDPESETGLYGLIGSPAIPDDPNTPEDESRPGTGVYGQIDAFAGDISDQIDTSQEETNQYLDYISGVIGRPASELTQDDVDMVIDLLAEDEFISDFNNDMRLYDVNFDGQIDQSDIGLLQGFVDAGVEGIGEIPATGIYADAARRQEEITGSIADQAGETRELIGDEAAETRRIVGQQNLFNALLGSGDLMGRQVDVKTPDPVQLKYVYDFSDIFATPQQRGLFPSPYGAPQRQAAQQVAQQRGIMSGPLNLGGLQRPPGMAAGGKVDYDFTDEIMHIMSYGDS